MSELLLGARVDPWWQYAAAGLLVTAGFAVFATGRVETCEFDQVRCAASSRAGAALTPRGTRTQVSDTFALSTWSMRYSPRSRQLFRMSDIANVQPCILHRNAETKHYKVIISFDDDTRVFVLETRSREVALEYVRQIRRFVFRGRAPPPTAARPRAARRPRGAAADRRRDGGAAADRHGNGGRDPRGRSSPSPDARGVAGRAASPHALIEEVGPSQV